MRASDVTPRPIDWLWYPNVPLGKLTAVAGQMGQAKSLLTMWMHAAVTTGRGIHSPHPASSIILNAEDDPGDTLRPRLEAASADLSRIWIEPSVTLDVRELAKLCAEIGDVRLVTIDPIQAYLPAAVNSWKGQDVRRFLEPLRQLANEQRFAVVLVQHLNRRSDAGEPLARIADSQGIPQLCRSVLVWGPDPGDPEGDQGSLKVLTRAKNNLARAGDSATFRIVETDVTGGITAPALVRGTDRHISADDVVTDHETRTAQDEAREWLLDALAGGPLAAKEVVRRAREIGISERTLKRAKRNAKVLSCSERDEAGITAWMWSLDTSVNDDGPLGIVGTVGPLGESQRAKDANEANHANGYETVSAIYGPPDDEATA